MASRRYWYRSGTGGWLLSDPDAPASARATTNVSPASARSPLSNAPTAASPSVVPASSKPFDWSVSSACIFASKPFSTVSPPGVEPSGRNIAGPTTNAAQTPRWSAGDASAFRTPDAGSPSVSTPASVGLTGSPLFTVPNSRTAQRFVPMGEPPPVFLQYAVDANGQEVRSQEDIALAYYEKRSAERKAAAVKRDGVSVNHATKDVLPPTTSPADDQEEAEEEKELAEETVVETPEEEYENEDEHEEEGEEGEEEEEERARAVSLPLASLMLSMSRETRVTTSSTGPIYSATMNDDATRVAVKIVKNVLSETDTDRFLEELHELQTLPPNRNVLRHYGYVALNNGKQLGVVMQLIPEAKTLKNCLYRSCDFDGPPVIVKYRLISWLLDGLAHLHANGIVHGDLTPKSVLVSREGSDFLPTLTNFGLPTLKNHLRFTPRQGRSPWF